MGRPATALSAAVSMTTSPNVQTSEPSSLRTSLGARSWYLAVEVVDEEVRRLDDVVIDADEDEIVDVEHVIPPRMSFSLVQKLPYCIVPRPPPGMRSTQVLRPPFTPITCPVT